MIISRRRSSKSQSDRFTTTSRVTSEIPQCHSGSSLHTPITTSSQNLKSSVSTSNGRMLNMLSAWQMNSCRSNNNLSVQAAPTTHSTTGQMTTLTPEFRSHFTSTSATKKLPAPTPSVILASQPATRLEGNMTTTHQSATNSTH